MISVSGKNWIERKVNKNSVEKIKQDYKFNEILSKLIVSRNFDEDEINNINNDLKIINIFKNNNDFKEASKILINSNTETPFPKPTLKIFKFFSKLSIFSNDNR